MVNEGIPIQLSVNKERWQHLDITHHLKVEVVVRALQNQSAAHVGRGVVEVKDHIEGIWTSLWSKYPVDLLGPLNLIGQVLSTRGAVEAQSSL